MAQIILQNFHLGGVSDSAYSGTKNSSYKLVGMNIHEEPGILKVQQDVVNDVASGDAITSIISAITPTGIGKTYFWGDGDDVWERNTSGVYSKISSADPISPASGDSAVLDAIVFDGSIYYSMPKRLGKWTIGTAWNTRDDNYAVLTQEDEFHPLYVIANDLYIGNNNQVAKVAPTLETGDLDNAAAVDQGGTPNIVRIPATDHGLEAGDSIEISGTTSYNGSFLIENVPDEDNFDIEIAYNAETFASDVFTVNMTKGISLDSKYVVQSFGEFRDTLLMGTIAEGSASTYSDFSKLFTWDTVSPTFNNGTATDEFGINAFINFFGSTVVQAGSKGMLYSYDGVNLQRFKRIPGDWSGNTAIIKKNAVSSYFGIPVFGFSNVSGEPAEQGVYMFGGYDAKYPKVFSLDFCSNDGAGIPTANSEINSIARIGTDLVFSSNVLAGTSQIKRIDSTKKYNGAYLITRVIDTSRELQKKMKVRVCYRTLPAGTSVGLRAKVNNDSFDSYTLIDYSNMNYLETEIDIADVNTVQLKISLFRDTANPNNAPEIEKIIIDF